MRRFFGVALLTLGLAVMPAISGAAPIGTNSCAGEVVLCDIFADYDTTGASELGIAAGNLGGYLVGYTLLLNQVADLSDGLQLGDVAHILVIHDALFQLFSNTVFSTQFDNVFLAATTGGAIDGITPTVGQLAGCPPVPSGVPNVEGVGYCTTADDVSMLVNWGFPDGSGGADFLTIHTALPIIEPPPPPPTDVPEPSTLSLLGLGAASLAIRRWRKA